MFGFHLGASQQYCTEMGLEFNIGVPNIVNLLYRWIICIQSSTLSSKKLYLIRRHCTAYHRRITDVSRTHHRHIIDVDTLVAHCTDFLSYSYSNLHIVRSCKLYRVFLDRPAMISRENYCQNIGTRLIPSSGTLNSLKLIIAATFWTPWILRATTNYLAFRLDTNSAFRYFFYTKNKALMGYF